MKFMIPLLVLVTLSSCSSTDGRYHVWFTPGHIQALGNENELWIFLEIDKMAHRPNVAYDTPKAIPIGHFQEVVVLQRDGSKNHFKVSIDNGVTFHPNLSLIFRAKDQFYLYDGESMFFKSSLFKWDESHFELLALETGNRFLDQYFSKDRKISLDELKKMLPTERAAEIFKSHKEYQRPKDNRIRIPYGIILDKLKFVSKSEGWNHFASDMFCCDCSFVWNGLDISIKSTANADKSFQIMISTSRDRPDDDIFTLTYGREEESYSRDEFELLMKNREKQEGHRKE
jgi:hypothetical protein